MVSRHFGVDLRVLSFSAKFKIIRKLLALIDLKFQEFQNTSSLLNIYTYCFIVNYTMILVFYKQRLKIKSIQKGSQFSSE